MYVRYEMMVHPEGSFLKLNGKIYPIYKLIPVSCSVLGLVIGEVKSG